MTKVRKIALWSGLIGLSVCCSLQLLSLTVPAAGLTPHWAGDYLEVSALNLHFLTGNPLERLRNGVAVPFDFQLTLTGADGNPLLHRSLERFVVSYDLWEERFSVVRLRNLRKSGSHLTAAAAESWCIENIAIPASSVPAGRNLWIKLEIRSAESKPSGTITEEGGISLTTLIEIFSRPTRNPQDHWLAQAGPFRLADLRR